jgi:ABC-type histidine transport system ATPase subunit
MLEITDLRKGYQRREGLRGAHLSASPGQVIDLVGPRP